MKQKFWKNFWHLFRGYWNSEEKWKARGLLAFVIGLNFASVYLLVRLNSWYNVFYNALQQYQAESFWPLIGEFTGLAFLYIILAVYAIYLRQMLQIKWRTWMTNRYLDGWMKDPVSIHISEPTRQAEISYAVFCLKKKKKTQKTPQSEIKQHNKTTTHHNTQPTTTYSTNPTTTS